MALLSAFLSSGFTQTEQLALYFRCSAKLCWHHATVLCTAYCNGIPQYTSRHDTSQQLSYTPQPPDTTQKYFLRFIKASRQGQRSRYSDFLRAARSEDRIPVGTRLSAPSQTGAGTTQPPIQWMPSFFPGDKAAGAWS
jgi:hypothetical protein